MPDDSNTKEEILIVSKIEQVCYKKDVNEQHGLSCGWKNDLQQGFTRLS